MATEYNVTPDMPFQEAARETVKEQLHEMMSHRQNTRDGDSDALHDMRVSSRRLRAALSVFGGLFRPKKFAPLEKQVAAVTDALGAVRDADVQIEYIAQVKETLPESEQVGVGAFLEQLQAQRDRDRVQLTAALDRLEKKHLIRDFERLLHG